MIVFTAFIENYSLCGALTGKLLDEIYYDSYKANKHRVSSMQPTQLIYKYMQHRLCGMTSRQFRDAIKQLIEKKIITKTDKHSYMLCNKIADIVFPVYNKIFLDKARVVKHTFYSDIAQCCNSTAAGFVYGLLAIMVKSKRNQNKPTSASARYIKDILKNVFTEKEIKTALTKLQQNNYIRKTGHRFKNTCQYVLLNPANQKQCEKVLTEPPKKCEKVQLNIHDSILINKILQYSTRASATCVTTTRFRDRKAKVMSGFGRKKFKKESVKDSTKTNYPPPPVYSSEYLQFETDILTHWNSLEHFVSESSISTSLRRRLHAKWQADEEFKSHWKSVMDRAHASRFWTGRDPNTYSSTLGLFIHYVFGEVMKDTRTERPSVLTPPKKNVEELTLAPRKQKKIINITLRRD